MMPPGVSSAVIRTLTQPNSARAPARRHVPIELPSVGAVVVTFVLDGQFEVLPAHIENGDQPAVPVVNRDLGSRRRKTGTDQKKPSKRSLTSRAATPRPDRQATVPRGHA